MIGKRHAGQTASTKKPPTSTSETRLEIVMVSRSLEAAKAISAGNNSNLSASTSIAVLRTEHSRSNARGLTFRKPRGLRCRLRVYQDF